MAKRAVSRGRRSGIYTAQTSPIKGAGIYTRHHKYGAKPTVVDGIRFASKREAKRYGELKLLERHGVIAGLILQPLYEISVVDDRRFLDGRPPAVKHKSTHVCDYRADFSYWDKERQRVVVEDVKGFKTPVYRLKKKLVEAQYGITITEV